MIVNQFCQRAISIVTQRVRIVKLICRATGLAVAVKQAAAKVE